jgi:hypothetical protein
MRKKKWLRKKFRDLVDGSLVLRRDIVDVLYVVCIDDGGFGRRMNESCVFCFRCHS